MYLYFETPACGTDLVLFEQVQGIDYTKTIFFWQNRKKCYFTEFLARNCFI